MELHQLRYFVAVAECCSFSRAAELCRVSQPSLSQQIAKLERRLGQKLFDRLGRGILLTDGGRQLLEMARKILATVDEAERRLSGAVEAQGGRLAVGAIPTMAPYLLPPLLRGFRRRHPGVELTVHEDVTRQLVTATASGELDIALIALPIHDERLKTEVLFTEPLLLALPPGHRLAGRRRIVMEDLREERFILLNEMHCLGEQVLAFCRVHDCPPRIACRSAQINTIQSLISLGQGVSLLPAMARRGDKNKQLSYRALSINQPTRTVAAMWHRHRYLGPTVEHFLAEVRLLAGTFQG